MLLSAMKRPRQSYPPATVTHVVALGGMEMWVKQNEHDFSQQCWTLGRKMLSVSAHGQS